MISGTFPTQTWTWKYPCHNWCLSSASWQQSNTPARPWPSQVFTGSKNRVCPLICLFLSFIPPLRADTDRLFHQLTLDPAYDERPKLALAALAENSIAPISPPLPPFRTTMSQRISLDAKLGPCCVLLKKLRQRSVTLTAESMRNEKNVWAQALQRLQLGLKQSQGFESLTTVKHQRELIQADFSVTQKVQSQHQRM